MANNTAVLTQKNVLLRLENQRYNIDEIIENTLYNLMPNNKLTKRENEILNLIMAGKTNKEISQKICRAERTIEYHRNRLMRKLGTKSAAELVKRAIALGMT